MKVYLAYFDNGESFEDLQEWVDDKVYASRQQCEDALINSDFKKIEPTENDSRYKRDNEWYDREYAKIIELELVPN